jgi:pimeloyl-ACP methyl ester carboxylesterase
LINHYEEVPRAQKVLFEEFRSKYIQKTINIDNREWKYLFGGSGNNTMIFFHGGYLNGDMYFHQAMEFGNEFYIIAPTCPEGVTSLVDITEATVQILEKESIVPKNLVLLGVSFGGMVIQVFLQNHPEMVEKAILSHTLSQDKGYARKFKSNLRQFRLLPWFILSWLFKRGGGKRMKNWAKESKWKELVNAYFSEYFIEELTKELIVNRTECLVDFWNQELTPKKSGAWKERILILASKDDNERIKKEVEKLKGMYLGAKVHWFEKGKGGHHTAFYFPEEYNNVVRNFITTS